MTSDDEIDEEIIADALEDAAKRNKLFGNITKSGNLIERVIAWLQDALRKFKEFLRNPQGKLTTEQFNRLSDEFGRMATSLVNQSGNKIFRYNRRTHTLEFADGRELKSVITGAKIKKSANEEENISEYERLQSFEPITVETGIAGNPTIRGVQVAINAFTEKYPQGTTVDTKIGNVTINKKSIKNSLSHLIYPSKIDSVLSLPEGLKIAA